MVRQSDGLDWQLSHRFQSAIIKCYCVLLMKILNCHWRGLGWSVPLAKEMWVNVCELVIMSQSNLLIGIALGGKLENGALYDVLNFWRKVGSKSNKLDRVEMGFYVSRLNTWEQLQLVFNSDIWIKYHILFPTLALVVIVPKLQAIGKSYLLQNVPSGLIYTGQYFSCFWFSSLPLKISPLITLAS